MKCVLEERRLQYGLEGQDWFLYVENKAGERGSQLVDTRPHIPINESGLHSEVNRELLKDFKQIIR